MKKLLTILTLLFISMTHQAQETGPSIQTALLIVDIQNFYFPGEGNPGLVNAEEAAAAASEVLKICREQQVPVVHVRHQSKKGFEIHPSVTPLPAEKVITKQEVNSFYKTDLNGYLRGKGINRLIIIGMQTQMCLEGAVRAAHDLGFDCIVVSDACATRDLTFGGKTTKAAEVQTAVLATLTDGRYAKVIDLNDFKAHFDQYLIGKK